MMDNPSAYIHFGGFGRFHGERSDGAPGFAKHGLTSMVIILPYESSGSEIEYPSAQLEVYNICITIHTQAVSKFCLPASWNKISRASHLFVPGAPRLDERSYLGNMRTMCCERCHSRSAREYIGAR